MKQVVISEGKIGVCRNGEAFQLPVDMLPVDMAVGEVFHISDASGCEAFDIAGEPELSGLEFVGLRESWQILSGEEYALAAKGAELLNWSRHCLHCSSCGGKLQRESELSKKCPDCGREYFPALSPAVVVLVMKGEEALLVHAANFKRPFYALVAGFVETGESLEECVRREVREETTLEIDNIRYVGSQSWPFPHQLMLGFVADYKSGTLRFADHELTDGAFFSRDNLPLLPTSPSLSRAIIDAWVERKPLGEVRNLYSHDA